jgi:hypothetical protein
MSELKSQILHSDPFKVRGIDNESNSTNLSSREGIYPNDANSNDANSNDANSNDVKHNDDNDCNSNCPEKSKPAKYDIPFELPSIPFP